MSFLHSTFAEPDLCSVAPCLTFGNAQDGNVSTKISMISLQLAPSTSYTTHQQWTQKPIERTGTPSIIRVVGLKLSRGIITSLKLHNAVHCSLSSAKHMHVLCRGTRLSFVFFFMLVLPLNPAIFGRQEST